MLDAFETQRQWRRQERVEQYKRPGPECLFWTPTARQGGGGTAVDRRTDGRVETPLSGQQNRSTAVATLCCCLQAARRPSTCYEPPTPPPNPPLMENDTSRSTKPRQIGPHDAAHYVRTCSSGSRRQRGYEIQGGPLPGVHHHLRYYCLPVGLPV